MRRSIFTIVLTVLSFSACSDFLMEKPKSIYTKDNAIVDEAGLKAAMVGAYSGLISLYVINTNTPIFYYMVGTDELCYRANNTNIRSIIDRFNYTPSEGSIAELWARYYAIIADANIVIDASRKLEAVDESVTKACEAEACFLRAWAYFQLVQFFGELPLISEPVTYFDYTVPRSSIKDVYSFIVKDLEQAAAPETLPEEIVDGHASHWAAKTLLAKVYLTMASSKSAGRISGYSGIEDSAESLYGKASALLKDIIDNSGRELLPVYSDVFDVAGKNVNKESIWEIQFCAQESYGTQWPKEMGLTNTGYSGTAGGWRYCALGGQYTLNSIPSFRGYYRSYTQDVRRVWNLCDSLITYDKNSGKPLSIKSIVGLSGIPKGSDLTQNSNSSLVTRSSATKYRWGDSWKDDYPIQFNYSNCPNNIIALRFADVLLMYAEAELALGMGTVSDAGLEAINRVQARARGVDAGGNPVTADAAPEMPDFVKGDITLEEIMKERARELCFEFWRRHDLVRTGMFETFLKYRNEASNLVTNFDPDKHYLLPVPQYEIDNSRNPEGMYQNPNYSNNR